MSHRIRARRGRIVTALFAVTALSTPAFAGTLVGSVVDASGVRGLQGAEVEIVEIGRVTSAGTDGTFRFADVPSGSYTLRTLYAGADESRTSVSITEDGTTRADIVLGTGDDTILVIGQQANLGSSISRQRAADGVSTVLTRDAVGQFPDQNVAEALRRAPGINVLNDQGEGRFVSVRGLNPNLNSTSINGNRVLATGGDERSAALDVIPSELVESIEIKKTLTPDMDGDTIGGSVEINTTSAFDRKTGFVSLKAEGSYNELQDTLSPKVGLDFSTRLGGNFGISGGISYNKRKFGSDNIEMAGWTEADNGIVYAEELEYRDYDVTRERIGGSLSFDARLGTTTELYLRGVYSRFDDVELRRRLIFGFDGEPSSGTDTSATFDSADDRIEVRRDLKDRQEIQTIKTVSFGGKTETGPWRLTYDAAWSEARQFEDGSVDPVRFRRRFEEPGELGVTIDTSNLQIPAYTINYGAADFLDPTGYNPTLLERTTDEDARDREYSLRGDVARSFALSNGTFEVQTGVKARFRDKKLDFTIDLFDDFDDGFTLADVLGKQTYGLADISPTTDLAKWRAYYNTNGTAGMGRNALESDWVSAAEDYRAKEDILAGYLMGRFDNSVLRVIGGVRVERTKNEFFANRLEVNEDAETLTITPINFTRQYTDWLPSLNVRYAPTRDMVLRAGAFRSVVRPKLGDIAPRFVVEENEDGDREGDFGNPDLKPYRAWNFDVTAEYYFARNAVVQGGVFYKRIDDFIVDAVFEEDDAPYNGVYNGIAFTEGTIPLNGERATVKGFEFAYQQALDFLPGALDGLLVNLNYTYTDAKGRLADGADLAGRSIALPSSSKHTLNAVLGYEKGPVSLRLSGAYRSGYLDEVGGEAEEDRLVKKHFQLDFSAKYQLLKNVQLIGEVVNILDEPYTAYNTFGGRERLYQYEEYGITAKFGVKANF
ncbi:TonB-dependent receptor [Sphingosinicella soli]|uniref:TonB-dependent receptor n=1 Tax=Sphingosinicella soli TaxID=333708 RepID=A0A7W7F7N3_9SPHN|nr:TonB-dependent receptor [Sphingosinicella soli]MBB4630803.1 TonB-dependent receptor [Sphingosinicella soli]